MYGWAFLFGSCFLVSYLRLFFLLFVFLNRLLEPSAHRAVTLSLVGKAICEHGI
jgi:hypothetical protein